MPKRFKVLLIDDFKLIRVILRRGLGELKIEDVHEAAEGHEALATIEAAQDSGHGFDVVFCDWNLPGLTGIEILKAARKNPKTKHVPFVMVTSEAEQTYVDTAFKEGAMGYIVKPFTTESLNAKLSEIFNTLSHAA